MKLQNFGESYIPCVVRNRIHVWMAAQFFFHWRFSSNLTSCDERNQSWAECFFIKRSYVWPDVTKLALKTNMRLLLFSEDSVFVDMLHNMVNGELSMKENEPHPWFMCFSEHHTRFDVYPGTHALSKKLLSWFKKSRKYDLVLSRFKCPD